MLPATRPRPRVCRSAGGGRSEGAARSSARRDFQTPRNHRTDTARQARDRGRGPHRRRGWSVLLHGAPTVLVPPPPFVPSLRRYVTILSACLGFFMNPNAYIQNRGWGNIALKVKKRNEKHCTPLCTTKLRISSMSAEKWLRHAVAVPLVRLLWRRSSAERLDASLSTHSSRKVRGRLPVFLPEGQEWQGRGTGLADTGGHGRCGARPCVRRRRVPQPRCDCSPLARRNPATRCGRAADHR